MRPSQICLQGIVCLQHLPSQSVQLPGGPFLFRGRTAVDGSGPCAAGQNLTGKCTPPFAHPPLSFNGFREISIKNTGSSSPVVRKMGLSINDKLHRHRPRTPETAYFRPFSAKIIPSLSKPEFINRWYQLWCG